MDDYIPRKSVYDALCKICDERGACEHTGQEDCHKVFSQIHAADVRENVHGKWIEDRGGDCICSQCRYEALFFYGGKRCKSDFCPNCGADMRGGKADA